MEPSKRHNLASTLLTEVTQKIEALDNTLAAQGLTRNGGQPAKEGAPLTLEQHALLAEHDWWHKAQKGLQETCAALEQAEKYEHQRGVN